MRKKRGKYIRQISMPAQRIGRRANAKTYLLRRVVFTLAVLLTLAFIGKMVLSFFGAEYVSLELSGNMHYTDLQIYDTLGKQLQNIITDSEEQTATYLKENLSYIKDAHITKHVMKRMLAIEVTERAPFALLRVDSKDNRNHSFFLVDNDGHVLKHIDREIVGTSIPDQFREMVVLRAIGDTLPTVGTAVGIPEVVLGLKVLKTALFQERNLATQIANIDARDARKIKLHLDTFRGTVWIAADAIESGLHHVDLFLKQHKNQLFGLIGESSEAKHLYLDVRFQDAVYLGRSTGRK